MVYKEILIVNGVQRNITLFTVTMHVVCHMRRYAFVKLVLTTFKKSGNTGKCLKFPRLRYSEYNKKVNLVLKYKINLDNIYSSQFKLLTIYSKKSDLFALYNRNLRIFEATHA